MELAKESRTVNMILIGCGKFWQMEGPVKALRTRAEQCVIIIELAYTLLTLD